MAQEDKQLLLIDLCARLPYGVKVLLPEIRQDIATLVGKDDKCFTVSYDKSIIHCPFGIEIKPYLRPMSSMTEEEVNEYNELCGCNAPCPGIVENEVAKFMDWLNSHHFDYRGLIEKGLALEAPEGMYDLK